MTDTRDVRRVKKVARTLIRLKHSLKADDELEEFLEAQRAALTEGRTLELDVNLSDIMES